MTGTIQIPSKGDGLKAAWGASVANGLNALMPMAPARMLVREGAGGVGCEPLPQNLRDRKAAAAEPTLPWTFRCTVGEDENGDETRSGGWYNAHLQIGLNANVRGCLSPNVDPSGAPREDCDITGVTQTADGEYYAEVDLVNETAVLKIADGLIPPGDWQNNKLNVYVGTVSNGKQTDGIYCVPCIYKRIE